MWRKDVRSWPDGGEHEECDVVQVAWVAAWLEGARDAQRRVQRDVQRRDEEREREYAYGLHRPTNQPK